MAPANRHANEETGASRKDLAAAMALADPLLQRFSDDGQADAGLGCVLQVVDLGHRQSAPSQDDCVARSPRRVGGEQGWRPHIL